MSVSGKKASVDKDEGERHFGDSPSFAQSGGLLIKISHNRGEKEMPKEEKEKRKSYDKISKELINLAEEFRSKYGASFSDFPILESTYDNIMRKAFKYRNAEIAYHRYEDFYSTYGASPVKMADNFMRRATAFEL